MKYELGRSKTLLSPRNPTEGYATLAAFVVVALAAGLMLVVQGRGDLPDDAVLQFGDDVVTEQQFGDQLHVLEGLYGLKPPTEGKQAEKFQKDAAKAVAVSMVLDRAAEDAGVSVSGAEVNEQLNKLIESGYGGDRSKFVKMLGDKGIDQDAVLEEITNQLQTVELYKAAIKDVPKTTDADAKKYYQENKAQMVSPAQRRIDNIVVTDRATANTVLKAIRQGHDFAAVAKKQSIDEATREKGGALGMLAASDLTEAYAKVAFSVSPGETFGPVKTDGGWNVGQVTKVVEEVPMTFKQLRATIMTKLDNDKRASAWNVWLRKQLEAADVEYANQYRPDDPTEPPADAFADGSLTPGRGE